jgi:hypothetical protein
MKKSSFLMKTLLLVIVLLLTSCDKNSPFYIAYNPPGVDILSVQKYYESPFGRPKMRITVESTGDTKAYTIYCYIKLKQGNRVVATGSGYFGSLEPGEYTSDEVSFSGLDDHNEYSRAEYTLTWYDGANQHYEK